jgi:uncharacterized phage protein gp47/JayE
MSDYGLTPEGFNSKRLPEIKESIETKLKDSFGSNIDLQAESVFGGLVGITSEAIADLWELADHCYNAKYPRTAQGAALSNVVEYNGLQRQAAEFSTVNLTFTGTDGTTIPIGFQAENANGYVYETTIEATISGTTVVVLSKSVERGLFDSAPGTITIIKNPIYGVDSVTNVDAVTAGRFEESDIELRLRREESVAIAGQNAKDALDSQLKNVVDVFDAVVTSNGTDSIVDGVPAHTFRSVVYGGDNTDIANTIWYNTPQGILSSGSTTVTVQDSTGNNQDVKFTRPTAKPVYFDIELTVDSNKFIGSDTDIVKEAVADFGTKNFKISDNVLVSRFFIPIMTIEGVLDAVIKLGFSSAPTNEDNLIVASEEITTYNIANIGVTIA